MKRFTETQKWQDRWFSELPPEMMLAWLYLLDTCDAAGVVDAPGRVAAALLPLPVDWDAFLERAGTRLRVLPCGKWWLTGFLAYQYKGGVSPTSKQHEPARRSIEKHSLPVEYLFDTHSTPIREVLNTSQEKEKEKEKETDKETLAAFWDAYPKVGRERSTKAKVETEWRRLKAAERPTLETLMAALKGWKASDHWAEGYVKGAHLFVRERFWESVPEQTRQLGAGFATGPPKRREEPIDGLDAQAALEILNA